MKKYQGKFISIEEKIIDSQVWEMAFFKNSVIVFPLTDNKEVYMILEKRPHERVTERLKFVTGHIDEGETALATAAREIQEEIGIKANRFEEFMVHSSSGTINSSFHYFLAEDLEESKLPNPDGEDTILRIDKVPLKEIKRMIYADQMRWSLDTLGILKLIHRFGI